ncbi:hypothetical protein Pan216_46850 [Planctomycetes bacterium Pan216]|uniref:Nickel uptake substrate-specific transmembrane region n=1 Tax=Kolteria novifilia TaxID=2527975 RepID=A0A518BA00_9BACT|nr:hypothetical protein Pan216_46850 [Planctomycetes bacterium Pan216]
MKRSTFAKTVPSLALAVFLQTISAGCSSGKDTPPTSPVSGLITKKGQPVVNANVVFTPEAGRPASGKTDHEGHFTLTTFAPGDGAVPGNHGVAIISSIPAEKAPPGMQFPMKMGTPLDPRYANPKTSGLTANVATGESNHFEFAVD